MLKLTQLQHIFIAASLLLFNQQVRAQQPPSPVKTDTVQEINLSATTDLMATIHSRSHVQITAGVDGRIDWLAQPGTLVNQGDVLVKMDLLPLRLRKLEQQAQLKRAEINARYLKNELGRLQKLKLTDSASQFQLDQNQSQYDLARTDIEIAQLKLQQIDDQIQRATVTAPFDGVITERLVRAGSDINRSKTLLRILDTKNLEVRVFVPVKYLPFIHKGLGLDISAHDRLINAQVSALIPSADPKSQTFEVRIDLPLQISHDWAAGQLVKVTVPIQAGEKSLTVHRDALILRQDGTYVVKVDSDNKVKRLPVTVGTGTFDRVSISGELIDGDKVAIRGAERLQDGQEVIEQ